LIKNKFTYSEVVELLEKLNGSDVKDVNKWLDEQIDDGLTKEEKLSYICENEAKILSVIRNGHKACDTDEYAPIRKKMKLYRKQLGLI
jgi:hypothetical protein